MGFFFGNYSKPGRGISIEEAKKRNYFDILTRHFWDMIKINLLYVLANSVFFAAIVLFSLPYFADYKDVVHYLVWERYAVVPILPFVPFMLMGPFKAGLNYVTLSFARQEHTFIFSDFWEHSKKNLRQGLAVSVTSTLAVYLFVTAVLFYLKSGFVSPAIVLFFVLMFSVILVSASFYFYPMMVTFDLKLHEIFKNSFIFAYVKIWQNIALIIAIASLHLLLLWYVPLTWVFLMFCILISITTYSINFHIWGVLDKYIIQNNEQQ